MTRSEVVKLIDDALSKRKMTRSALAAAIGIKPSSLHEFMEYDGNASPDTCARISEALGIGLDMTILLANAENNEALIRVVQAA